MLFECNHNIFIGDLHNHVNTDAKFFE